MTDDNLRGLPLPIPIYFPAIPLRVTVCVTLCQDDILLTTYYIDDKMTYCWLRLLLMTWWHNVNNVLVFPAVDHHPNGDNGGKTKPKPHKHVLIEFSLLQTWEFSYFLFLICRFLYFLFLTFHLVRAIVLPAIPDVVAYKFSGTKVLSVSISDYWNLFSLWPKFYPPKKSRLQHLDRNHHRLPGDAIRWVFALKFVCSILTRGLVLKTEELHILDIFLIKNLW